MTARETPRISDPKLFQNMFPRTSAYLPADVAKRRNLGQNIPSDADTFHATGFNGKQKNFAAVSKSLKRSTRISVLMRVVRSKRRIFACESIGNR